MFLFRRLLDLRIWVQTFSAPSKSVAGLSVEVGGRFPLALDTKRSHSEANNLRK